jgi:hypothetical protein
MGIEGGRNSRQKRVAMVVAFWRKGLGMSGFWEDGFWERDWVQRRGQVREKRSRGQRVSRAARL